MRHIALFCIALLLLALPPSACMPSRAREKAASSPVPDGPPRLSHEILSRIFHGDTLRILEEADSLTLLSLDPRGRFPVPYRIGEKPKPTPPPKTIPGPDGKLVVLGEVALNDPQQRHEIIEALFEAISHGHISMMCFQPHHALRATRQGKTILIIFCFECGNGYVYEGNGTRYVSQFVIGFGPHSVIFNKILMDHKVPIAD